MHARPLDYLDVLVLHRAHAPCIHMHVMHAQCDALGFAYNVNNVIMMSLAFTYHSYHIGMRWHDVLVMIVQLEGGYTTAEGWTNVGLDPNTVTQCV